VYNRWVEIMMETPDKTICVTDWNRFGLAELPTQTKCGKGRVYTCRESMNTVSASGQYTDTLALRFYCEGSSCESSDFQFKWRVTAR
jgi:hypothetical protein